MKLVIVRQTDIDKDKNIFTYVKMKKDRNIKLYLISFVFFILTVIKVVILGYTLFSLIWLCIEFMAILVLLGFTYRGRKCALKALENIDAVNNIYATAVDSNTADVRIGTKIFRLRSKIKTNDIIVVYTSGCILFDTEYVDTLPVKDNV